LDPTLIFDSYNVKSTKLNDLNFQITKTDMDFSDTKPA